METRIHEYGKDFALLFFEDTPMSNINNNMSDELYKRSSVLSADFTTS